MRTPLFFLFPAMLMTALSAASGCAEDGATANCKPIALYNLNEAGAFNPDDCATPIGHAVSPTGSSGSAGTGGAGGTSGSGGSGG